MERWAVFAALPWEERMVLRSLAGAARRADLSCAAWSGRGAGREIWLVRTGMGVARAAAAAEKAAQAMDFDGFVSTGCAAGLVPGLAPGDLVVATSVVAGWTGERFAVHEALRDTLATASRRSGARFRLGGMFCSGELLATQAAKAAAGALGAISADMEGAGIARVAAAGGIRFGAVRAILDPLETEIREAGGIVDPETGHVRIARLLARLAGGPIAWSELAAVRRMMSAASASLTSVFAALFDESGALVCGEKVPGAATRGPEPRGE